ncbi:MAG: hypothetical protein Q9200_001459 [Gallowayella weberi]
MHRQYLPANALQAWTDLNGIESKGITINQTSNGRGLGLIATKHTSDDKTPLTTVPAHLVLSLENVWIHAKSDRHLQEVLEVVGDYSRSARGAILIFLLMQITHAASIGPGGIGIGISGPSTEYIKFLPGTVPLPIFWTDEEKTLAAGTSLEAALEAKLRSLDREFAHLRASTASIGWCQECWWHSGTEGLTFEDWKQVDAMYRSRALDLPGTGHAMVPYIDMANHASGDETVALYDTDSDGNAVLLLRGGKTLKPDDEVTITYGDEKGACEMLFSYGFIEDTMASARELFLDLAIPDDDPLKLAKKSISRSAPGFKLFQKGDAVDWEGDFVWLVCVNEEDGLRFGLVQTIDGKQELKVLWKDIEMSPESSFANLLKGERLWDVFQLRATIIIQGRVEQQLLALERRKATSSPMPDGDKNTGTLHRIILLRELEETLMLQAYDELEKKVSRRQEILYVNGY